MTNTKNDTATRTVATLTAADLGKKVRVRDYNGKPFIGELAGVELYRMPRRTVLHIGEHDGWADEVFVHPDFPIEVVSS